MRKLSHFFCRKMSWTPTFVILFSANLVFYKDQKAAAQVPFDSTNWNFGQVVKIYNFAKFKITEMWPFLLCHVKGFSKVPPPIFWWIFIPYTTSSLYCTKVLLSWRQIPNYIMVQKSISWIWGQLKTEYRIP